MKKWVLLILVAAFFGSNFYEKEEKGETPSPETFSNVLEKDNSVKEDFLNKEEKLDQTDLKSRHFLLLALDNGLLQNAAVAKMNDETQIIEVAALAHEDIGHSFPNKLEDFQGLLSDKIFINTFESEIGIKIDHIIAVDKNGYMDLFSRIFPNGISLQLTDEMKKDLNIRDQQKKTYLDANEFFKTIQLLKQTQKYNEEINELLINTVSTELYNPDVVLSLFGTLNEMNEYFFTDLTMEEFLTIGLNIIRNPVEDVQKLEVPNHNQEVIKDIPINAESL